MKAGRYVAFLVAAVLLTGSTTIDKTPVLAGSHSSASLPSHRDQPTSEMINEAYGKLPLSFEANEGQFDSQVQFASRSAGNTMYLTSTEAVLRLADSPRPESHAPAAGIFTRDLQRLANSESNSATLRMRLVGADTAAKVTGLDQLPGKSNYFIGNDPKKWRVNVPTYAKVKYEQVYRGVDLVYYGNQRQLEYDLIVAPGADPGRIMVAFDGAEKVRLDDDGNLVLTTAAGEARQHKPFVYQSDGVGRREISARYEILDGQRIRFDVDHYNASKPLVIDPQLSYSTYLGGSGGDFPKGITVDASGNAYITGLTFSADFPTRGAIQPNRDVGSADAFVTKLNSTGTALVYSTYLGGAAADQGNAISVDSFGNAYVTGQTNSTNFPLANAFQGSHTGSSSDAFLTKLNSSGNALVYSTYLGGNQQDIANCIAVDGSGGALIAGTTASPNFPLSSPWRSAQGPGFVTRFDPAGASLSYSTYFGSQIAAIAVDSAGNAYFTGPTFQLDLPLINAVQQNLKGATLFKSVDGAQNWVEDNNTISRIRRCNTIVVDPITPTNVYSGISGLGIFKSTDAGGSWIAVNNIDSTLGVTQLTIDPLAHSTIYSVNGSNGLCRSTDGGLNWTLINFFGPFNSVSIDPLNNLNLYSPGGQGFSKSTDGGATWQKLTIRDFPFGTFSSDVNSLAIDPVTPSTIYAADVTGVFKSLDGGAHWRLLNTFFFSANGVGIDPGTPSTLYSWSSGGGALKSTDSGQTWSAINSGLTDRSVQTLVIDPTNTSILYAGTISGVFKSTDAGNTWNRRGSRLTNLNVKTLALNPQNTLTIYAGTDVSSDGFVAKFNPSGSALLYSTYLGGDAGDGPASIAVDTSGNAYVTGSTGSLNFPTRNPVQLFAGYFEGFVTKLSTDHSEIFYSTYLGGSGFDFGSGIAVDAARNAYVTGETWSDDFPLVSPLQTSGGAFILKLNSAGTAIAYSTRLAETDYGYKIAVDSAGSAYVIGSTNSDNFTTTSGAFQRSRGGTAPTNFVTRLASFDVCLQDDGTSNSLQFDLTTGNYQFDSCDGVTIVGTATAVQKGCRLTIQGNEPDRSVFARVSTCSNTGTASIEILSQGKTYSISDSNINNNTCACAGSRPGLKR